MDFLLIDHQPPGRQINRDQTGTYGSDFRVGSLLSWALGRLKRGGVRLPVLSFSYAAAILRQAGHTVRITSDIPAQSPDVALFATVMYHWRADMEFLARFKKAHPRSRVVLIGAFSQTLPELFAPVADGVIHGEVEPALFAFLNGEWDFRGVFKGGPADPATLPVPDWDGFPVSRYAYRPVLPRGNFLTVQTSRGCAFGCQFCPYLVIQGSRMRYRDPARVEEELHLLATRHGVRSVLFRDILFTASKARTLELCQRIERLDLGLDWACETHVDTLSEDLVAAMARAGLKAVNLGIESGSPEVLGQAGKKGFTDEKLTRVLGWFESRGVRVQAFYMLGLPGDTAATMERTIALAKKLNTFSAQFCLTTPFPGTPFFEEMRDRLLHEDWSRYTGYDPVISLPGATLEEVRRAKKRAYDTYYLRPQWLLKHGLAALKGLCPEKRG